jgi:hypothetical protein
MRPVVLVVTCLALAACSAAPSATVLPSAIVPSSAPATPSSRATAAPTSAAITAAPASPSPIYAPSATPSETANSTPARTTAPGLVANPGDIIVVPVDAVRTLGADVPRGHGFAQDGPKASYVDDAGVKLVNLETGSTELVASGAAALDLSGNNLVWVSGRYDRETSVVPCGSQGSFTWRIRVFDDSTGTTKQVDQGVANRVEYCNAWPPVVAVDGDLLAYAVESPMPDSPEASTIVVRSVQSGEVVRMVESPLVIGAVDIDNGDVAYIAGDYPADPGPYDELVHERLMLSTVNRPDSIVVSRDPDEISFSHGRLSWFQSGDLPQPCFTATVDNLVPVEVGERSGPPWSDALTSGSFVSFASNDLAWVWDESSGVTYPVQVPAYPEIVSTNGGWLVWAGNALNDADPAILQGLPVEDVPGIA